MPQFEKPADYADSLRVLAEALDQRPTRIPALVLMANHWHFVLWPEHESDLSAFWRWMPHTHSMRWHARQYTLGSGHIDPGRFSAFPVESDDHLFTV